MRLPPYDGPTIVDYEKWMDEKVDTTVKGVWEGVSGLLDEARNIMVSKGVDGEDGDKVAEVCQATGTIVAFLANWGVEKGVSLEEVLVHVKAGDRQVDIVDTRAEDPALRDTDFIRERDVEAALEALAKEGSKGASEARQYFGEKVVLAGKGSNPQLHSVFVEQEEKGKKEEVEQKEKGAFSKLRAFVLEFLKRG